MPDYPAEQRALDVTHPSGPSNPESDVIAAITALEREPWWTAYESAAERGFAQTDGHGVLQQLMPPHLPSGPRDIDFGLRIGQADAAEFAQIAARFQAAFDQMKATFVRMAEQINAAMPAMREALDALSPTRPVPQTIQQRALPRPSSTPPMWANDPTRTNRRRNG